MGVHGLWRLIEASGKAVPLETLENKTLAVDVSIWLHQAVKGFQDSKGAPIANAHLLGIYHRICKLLYFKIKPVFVFDGGVPALKRQTIAKRNQQKHRNQNEADRLHKNVLESLLKHTALSKVLSEKAKAEISTHTSPIKSKSKSEEDNLFFLPPAAASMSDNEEEEDLTQSDIEDSPGKKHWDLHTIDTESVEFKSLPVDVRHEILTDLKETRKQNSWGRLHELPTESDEFSIYQMSRLLKRQSVQSALEKAEQEMGGHSFSLAELEKLMKDQGVISTEKITGSRIASDENTRYLLIKDIRQAIVDAKKIDLIPENTIGETQMDAIQKQTNNKAVMELRKDFTEQIKKSDNDEHGNLSQVKNKADIELENDLKNAIELSLMDVPSTSGTKPKVNERKTNPLRRSILNNIEDSDFGSSEEDEINCTNQFPSAKQFMNEYSGLTHCEIGRIISNKSENKMDNTTAPPKSTSTIADTDVHESTTRWNKLEDVVQSKNQSPSKIHDFDIISRGDPNQNSGHDNIDIVDSDTSDDFIEIEETHTDAMEVIIIPDENMEEDIFADIFATSPTSDTIQDREFEGPVSNDCVQNDLNLELVSSEISSISDYDLAIKEPTLESKYSLETCTNASEDIECHAIADTTKDTTLSPTKVEMSQNRVAQPELSVDQLKAMKENINKERMEFEVERGTRERLASNITDQMYQEAQELLQFFGIPYIIAPMEAEAQCAFLDLIELTDGTITDDSDIWLFGGRTVYKNFFNQSKNVMEYRSDSIERNFKLTREQMILLAMLVGSDYTVGLTGVGPVTALEILAAFPMKTDLLLSGLLEFKQWWDKGKLPGPRRTALRSKLKNLVFIENFPNPQIVSAYLEPRVETSGEKFSWSAPDVVGLRDFARRKFGWTKKKTDQILLPVLKRLEEKKSQTCIRDYFATIDKTEHNRLEKKMSKRVQTAIKRIGTDPSTSEEPPDKSKRQRKQKKPTEETLNDDLQAIREHKRKSERRVQEIELEITQEIEKNSLAKKVTVSELLHKKEVIPQRQKDKSDMLKNKLKAIEIFRRSTKGPGYVNKRTKTKQSLKQDASYLSESSSD